MGVSRRLLLAVSESSWLRTHAPRWWFVKKAAMRFMPGDTFEDAFSGARALHRHGIGVVFTRLGENVSNVGDADEVRRHYADVLTTIGSSELSGQISVKLTQLGLDLDLECCHANVRALAEHARPHNTYVWIDMEQHAYLERTLTIYRRLLGEFANVGVCLQAYLYRTKDDLLSLLPLGGGIRLVKGAYREPASIAYPNKRDVDRSFLDLADQMLAAASAGSPAPAGRAPLQSRHAPRIVFGTHDRAMLDTIARHADRASVSRDAFEFHLLFGIQPALQIRLAEEQYRVRILISYGDQWFAWYMRRLAERPANVLFAVRSMFQS
jgi:proline dehydrogenase